MLSRTSVERWCFEWSEQKLAQVLAVARRHKGDIRMPEHIKRMSESMIERADLETKVYMKFRYRKDVLKRHIDFK